jgi:hypothetical protein
MGSTTLPNQRIHPNPPNALHSCSRRTFTSRIMDGKTPRNLRQLRIFALLRYSFQSHASLSCMKSNRNADGSGCCPTAGYGCCPLGCCPTGKNCCTTSNSCVEPGGVCCDGDFTCPSGWDCCTQGTCFPKGGQCCSTGFYCTPGNVCVLVNGVQKCCTEYVSLLPNPANPRIEF